ncbi:MAG: prolyl oligopeptidase family serine peptidase [Caldilineaceae bacterium]
MQTHHLQQTVSKTVELPYWLHLPKTKTNQPLPLILFLHGRGESGSDLEVVKKHGIPKILAQDPDFPPLAPFIVAAPQCPWHSWWPEQADALDVLLEELLATYPIDPQRIYLTGLSMGGFGTWYLACRTPERFAAIAPICGGGYWVHGFPDWVLELKQMPTWVFHGAKDPVVPLSASQQLVDLLQANGGNVRFTVYPEALHDSWTESYDNPELYTWLLQHKR